MFLGVRDALCEGLWDGGWGYWGVCLVYRYLIIFEVIIVIMYLSIWVRFGVLSVFSFNEGRSLSVSRVGRFEDLDKTDKY